jgi:hypothetical protein
LSQRKEEEARQSYEHTTEKEEETRVPAHLLNGTLDPVASDVLLPPGIHQLERAPTEAHLVSFFFFFPFVARHPKVACSGVIIKPATLIAS